MSAEQIRFRGTVQGVGFRPTVARLARAHGLQGWVRNDAEGVLVTLEGASEERESFLCSLLAQLPPLARVDRVERAESPPLDLPVGFEIVPSAGGAARTQVSADAATCAECAAELRDPFSRRYRYPFTNCTHCGPRFTIVTAIPYDRPDTTMAGFPMCADCRAEYEDPTDRRYHAQPIACHACGPRAELVRTDGRPSSFATHSMLDDVDAARTLLRKGEIVAIKGLGGYQLCCDATNEDAVALLRRRKHRPHKPLAMMAWDVGQVRRYCDVSAAEAAALNSPAAPIVLLDAAGPDHVAPSVAPGQRCLGFMLPSTPLHLMVLRGLDRPIVCTSGNRSEEPQCVDDADAMRRLGDIADWMLRHDRPIAVRVDDSVVREIGGKIRSLRRARGYAPAPLLLHRDFADLPPVTALGGHLKSTFCLLQGDQAVLSPHVGDLDEPRTVADYQASLARLDRLFDHQPTAIAADMHPGYRTTELGQQLAMRQELPLHRLQHHHAHAAACMAENGLGPDTPPVLGIILDGLGYGPGGSLWGGEFLEVEYTRSRRLAALPAVPLLGGDRCAVQPWRSLYAHVLTALGWNGLADLPQDCEVVRYLDGRRSRQLDRMLSGGFQALPASSCGRLFDAVAAALDLHREQVTWEGQAAVALEAIVDHDALDQQGYELGIAPGDTPRLTLDELWRALLTDLADRVDHGIIAARFHVGLARGLARTARLLRQRRAYLDTVVLSGGVWQNRVLAQVAEGLLEADGWQVLTHRLVPPNDGCVALGQAVIAACRTRSELE